jgi:hypothetical protein
MVASTMLDWAWPTPPMLSQSGTSIYFRDPDGARVELIADPLGEMYGRSVL